MNSASNHIEYEIKPGGRLQLPDLRELWESRDLIAVLVRRDYLVRYSQTVLGPVWFLVQPLATSLVFTVIFGNIAKISTQGLPHMLFYLSALLPWAYFSQTFSSSSTVLTSNQSLFSKTYFPRLAPALASAISNLLAFFVQVLLFIAFWCYYKFFTPAGADFHLSPLALLLPVVLVQTALLGIGCGLWMSVVTAKYRDLQHAMGFLVQLWMYATPIIYSLHDGLGKLPEFLRPILWLNPMSIITATFRDALLGSSTVTPAMIAGSWGLTLLILIPGAMLFRKVESNYIDTV